VPVDLDRRGDLQCSSSNALRQFYGVAWRRLQLIGWVKLSGFLLVRQRYPRDGRAPRCETSDVISGSV
jgi:hypothetical protein